MIIDKKPKKNMAIIMSDTDIFKSILFSPILINKLFFLRLIKE